MSKYIAPKHDKISHPALIQHHQSHKNQICHEKITHANDDTRCTTTKTKTYSHVRRRTNLQKDVGAENKREENLVSLHERATHVTVETVRKVVGQVAQATLDNLRLVAARSNQHANRYRIGTRIERLYIATQHSTRMTSADGRSTKGQQSHI